MSITERAIDYFIITQAKENNRSYIAVSEKVKKTIEDLGESIPGDLPTPEKSIKTLERQEHKKMKSGGEGVE